MFYRQELSFLCEIFQKSHIAARIAEQQELIGMLTDKKTTDPFFLRNLTKEAATALEARTLYHLTDALSLSYRILLLPDTDPFSLLIIGPFRTSPFSRGKLFELGEKNGIPPHEQRYFTEYYESIPIIAADAPFWIMLHTFCEHIWQTPSFSVKEISCTSMPSIASSVFPSSPPTTEDPLLNVMTMERRYAFENEMIRAVEQGRTYIADSLLSSFSPNAFENRLSDTLRNAKNYCIIMNTLLRKAAERGGVHPIYIDRRSTEFAMKIEALASPDECTALMSKMFRSYCRLVQEHSIKHLPPLIQKAVVLIDTELSSELSPGKLAKTLEVSAGYLSARFKGAMHQTLSEYICHRRMEHAAYLLETTSLQIQTVALHCGIMDVQYFSKLFKKQLKVTPTQYRTERRALTHDE